MYFENIVLKKKTVLKYGRESIIVLFEVRKRFDRVINIVYTFIELIYCVWHEDSKE